MPYIKKQDREKFDPEIDMLARNLTCAGDINYVISRMMQLYIEDKGLKYATLNEVIGALECCKLELVRKVVSPYEDKKIAENGPIGILDDQI